MQPLPLSQRLDLIHEHIVRARLFLDLWFYFEERNSRRQIIKTVEEYNEFFRFTSHAYLIGYVIYSVRQDAGHYQFSAPCRRGEGDRTVKRPGC